MEESIPWERSGGGCVRSLAGQCALGLRETVTSAVGDTVLLGVGDFWESFISECKSITDDPLLA